MFSRLKLQNDYQEICPDENIFETKDSSFFGDNWSDLLTEDDKKNLSNYFLKFEYLKKKFGFINFRIGKKDFNLKLSDRKEGIKIETPRNSLIMSVRYNIFDDILIGNFAKFELINVPDLYPDFTPYVAKYGDNGNSRTLAELKSYFEYYKLNSTSYWQDMLKLKTEDIIRSKIKKHRKIFSFLRSLRNQF